MHTLLTKRIAMFRVISVVKQAALCAVVAVVSQGCVTTKEEGDLIRKDIASVREDERKSRDAQSERSTDLENRIKAIEERGREMAAAQKELDERNLRNKADFGQELTNLGEEVARLRG